MASRMPSCLDRKRDRKSTRLNSSHHGISYAVFCLKKQKPVRPHAMRSPSRLDMCAHLSLRPGEIRAPRHDDKNKNRDLYDRNDEEPFFFLYLAAPPASSSLSHSTPFQK